MHDDPEFSALRRLVSTRVADALEGAFDQLFALFTDVVIDRGHCLNRTGSRTGKGEFAVGHFALVQCECAITENHEAAIGEAAGFVFVEIEDHFFVFKIVFADFHLGY